MTASGPSPGAVYLGAGRCRFRVWAPRAGRIDLHLVEPAYRLLPMHRDDSGHFLLEVEGVKPGTLYRYRIDSGPERPDPASRGQPRGVHGPSSVVDPAFDWDDPGWRGLSLPDLVLYEIHVGTFTPEGTFDAAIDHLEALRDLGVTAIELMPVASFPGDRNWGYDGVYPFAVQDSYGGPDGLKRLINACHRSGLGVILDVVYNHLGPEGNHLADFGPYFTDRYRTPWGAAINFDGPGSDEVRAFFLASAVRFATEFRLDGFRIDAVHGIVDTSAYPFLVELTEVLHATGRERGRPVLVIGESDLNDSRVIRPPDRGGWGMDAQWADDFHHAVHALLTGERGGYYRDFGRLEDIARAFRNGYVYTGQFSIARGRRHGNSTRGCPADRFVVFLQNHDQIGNRARGDRLAAILPFSDRKLAACVLLLSPYLPLLFMGQEYGETAPFHYFISHSDPELTAAVRDGRRREFAAFGWDPEEIPDPDDGATFTACRPDRSLLERPAHGAMRDLYRELLRLRRDRPALGIDRDRMEVEAFEDSGILAVRRWSSADEAMILFGFGKAVSAFTLPPRRNGWRSLLDTEDRRWGGEGSGTAGPSGGDTALRVQVRPRSCRLLVPAGTGN